MLSFHRAPSPPDAPAPSLPVLRDSLYHRLRSSTCHSLEGNQRVLDLAHVPCTQHTSHITFLLPYYPAPSSPIGALLGAPALTILHHPASGAACCGRGVRRGRAERGTRRWRGCLGDDVPFFSTSPASYPSTSYREEKREEKSTGGLGGEMMKTRSDTTTTTKIRPIPIPSTSRAHRAHPLHVHTDGSRTRPSMLQHLDSPRARRAGRCK
jgi:hypothetical protein